MQKSPLTDREHNKEVLVIAILTSIAITTISIYLLVSTSGEGVFALVFFYIVVVSPIIIGVICYIKQNYISKSFLLPFIGIAVIIYELCSRKEFKKDSITDQEEPAGQEDSSEAFDVSENMLLAFAPQENKDEKGDNNMNVIEKTGTNVNGDETIWVFSNDGTARYVLGEVSGPNPIICFGVNPSTATLYKDDPTIQSVRRIANYNGYDGYIMLNIYPQISKEVECIHEEPSHELTEENKKQITRIIQRFSSKNNEKTTLWAAWGGLIKERHWLPYLVRTIWGTTGLKAFREAWVTLDLEKYKAARHPLFVPGNTALEKLDMRQYIFDDLKDIPYTAEEDVHISWDREGFKNASAKEHRLNERILKLFDNLGMKWIDENGAPVNELHLVDMFHIGGYSFLGDTIQENISDSELMEIIMKKFKDFFEEKK